MSRTRGSVLCVWPPRCTKAKGYLDPGVIGRGEGRERLAFLELMKRPKELKGGTQKYPIKYPEVICRSVTPG